MAKIIVEKTTGNDTGFTYITTEDRSLWGVGSDGSYKSFSAKYYEIVEREDDDEDLLPVDEVYSGYYGI